MPDAAGIARWPIAQLLESANGLQQRGQPAAAAALYAAWLAGNPHSNVAHAAAFNQGAALSLAGRDDEAEACYRLALQHVPGFAPALLNLGHLHERAGRADAALAHWREVIDADPPAALEHRLHALNNSARLLESAKRLPEAEALMRASLELKPEQPDVIQHHVHVRQKQCAWPADATVGAVTPHQILTGTSLLAVMGLEDDPALQLLAAQRFVAEKVMKGLTLPAEPLWRSTPASAARTIDGGRRIRIGYASGDLHTHAVGLLTAELFELHDKSRFELIACDWTPESAQPQRQRLLAAFDHVIRLAGLDDAAAAQRIAEAGIDVLVDLQGLTQGARPGILVRRPAPVQVSYLGLPGTSAVPGVDWMLADAFVMPPALRRWCSERAVLLPQCYQVSDRRREVAPTPPRSRYGLPEDRVVFCSFNNNHKFTPEMFGAWMRILHGVPGSVLWLLADNDTARANLQREAADRGIGPERLVFAPRVSPAEYLARFACADLVLDTFPFNAGTTASDALWVGTPILTRAGRTFISRMAGSLLTSAGLPDLITESLDDYERTAITLGRHPARLASLKRYLAEHGRSSPLFDVPAIVRSIEWAFERLARDARAGVALPHELIVPPAAAVAAAPG